MTRVPKTELLQRFLDTRDEAALVEYLRRSTPLAITDPDHPQVYQKVLQWRFQAIMGGVDNETRKDALRKLGKIMIPIDYSTPEVRYSRRRRGRPTGISPYSQEIDDIIEEYMFDQRLEDWRQDRSIKELCAEIEGKILKAKGKPIKQRLPDPGESGYEEGTNVYVHYQRIRRRRKARLNEPE